MDKEIEAFRSQNGNVTYTVKELIGALHTKTDRLEARIGNMQGRFVTHKYFKGGFGLLLALIGGLAGILFFHLGII